MKNIYSLLFILLTSFLHAQTNSKLDDLLLKAYSSKDSSDYYFNASKKLLKQKADTANYYYFQFYRKHNDNEKDSAIYFAEKVIPLFKKLDTLDRLRKVYEQLHYLELNLGQYELALDYIQKALTVAEKMKDTVMISLHLSDKSNIYHDFEDYEKGVAFGKKAFKILHDHDSTNYKYLIFANNVIAINFDDWKKPDSALFYHYKNLKYIAKVSDSARFAFIFNNIGNTLLKNKRFAEAKKYIKRSLELNKMRQRDNNLATNYTNLATIAYEENKFAEAKEYFILANLYAEKSGSIEKIRDVVQQEAWFYKKTGDFEKALERQEAFYVLRDSVFNEERAAKVTEMATKYETAKTAQELAETRANLAESELAVEQKNILIFGSLGLAVILGLLGYLFYSQQKLKNRQLQKEGELKTALARIETQNELQEQRLRISRDLHDNIGSQLTFIISSIDSLKYGLKDAGDVVTQKLGNISAFTSNTIYELRDTIWAMNKNDITWEDLQARISNFIEKAGVAQNTIDFDFSVTQGVVADTKFTSIQGMNIYRIIQEALNNTLKYADATKVSVTIDKNASAYHITIKDNGKGFSITNIEVGHGLQNIKKRAKELGGTSEINSEVGMGTTVSIQFKA
ncbi:tetratricopeptide repeat protein [Ulvibacter sp. MAR_2010_11]|uniref:tetratricopeptide repeat-containing sensor histidine kinase n=1 Tax=Ulvibacter sp. MAR_2010_11 TaxID=1250229 RepID=UPI000C2B598D|nr:tetratricopeptide repeat protein [Ulvibacter sp. MAR_2010_11]PKA82412.1 tetratricopeptide repeat protein [Ulvibacter sp. MAR_2010_11]